MAFSFDMTLKTFCRFWYIILSIILLLSPVVKAQTPAWQTVIPVDTVDSGHVGSTIVATDPSGNVYIAGSFSGTANFGLTRLTSVGMFDVYVAKWNPITKSYAWVQQAGGRGDDFVSALTVTSNGIYVAGIFKFYANPNPITTNFGATTLTNPQGSTSDGFIAKLTDAGSNGNFVWAQRIGGVGDDIITALSATTSSVYATGQFASASATFGNTTLANAGGQDAFLTKLVDNGTTSSFGWTQQLGGPLDEVANAIVAAGPSVYVAGTFASPKLVCGSTTLANASTGNSADIFVAKLTDAGTTTTFRWAQRAGSIGDEQLSAMAVNGSNIYIGGNYYGFALPIGNTTLPTASMYDLFVAKLTDAGDTSSFTWAQKAGGYYNDRLLSLGAAGTNVYITGQYSSNPAYFGLTALSNVSTTIGYSDIFVARLSDAGNTSSFSWVQQAGGTGIDEVASLAVSGSQVYISGFANVPCAFGKLTLRDQGTSNGYQAYLAALTNGAALASTTSLLQKQVVLYPNPTHTSTVVQLPALLGASQATLTLRDALGRVVRMVTVSLPATGLSHELSLTGLNSGLYILHVQAGETMTACRLTID